MERLLKHDPGDPVMRNIRRAVLMGLLLTGGTGVLIANDGCVATFDVGVPSGGQQDAAGFRATIADGEIPNPEAITVEGLLSEHSIELGAAPRDQVLFMTTATAWNMPFDSIGPLATLALGFGTNVDAETFERPDLELCLVIDTSGSMREPIGGRTRTSKFEAVRVAVDRLLAQLTPDDRVSVVTFSEQADVRTESANGDDIAAIKGALDGVSPEGGTNLARGLVAGYEVLRAHTASGRLGRLLLFTDTIPTVGPDSSDDFLRIMESHAEDDLSATIFGVGADFGDEMASDIAQVRGGNYFFLHDYERVVTVFDEDFDFLVTPIAYDVRVTVNVPFEFDVDSVHGLPNAETNTHVLESSVPTLFFSSGRGGREIMVRLRAGSLVDFNALVPLADVTYSFRTTAGSQREVMISKSLPADLDPVALTPYFENDGAQRACLLTDTALVLRDSAEDSYFRFPDHLETNIFRARQRLSAFLPYFDDMAMGLEDRPSPTSRALSEEREVIVRFLDLLERF